MANSFNCLSFPIDIKPCCVHECNQWGDMPCHSALKRYVHGFGISRLNMHVEFKGVSVRQLSI